MKLTLIVMFLTLVVSGLFCIEVGGHITQNTTWSSENNPYIIVSFMYIDAGVTLTILPGTQIRCMGADKNNIYNFMWSGNNQPVSKIIIVNGAINAIGTINQPITFDKYQLDSNYRWGGIYMAQDAPISTFEFCEFRNVFFCDYVPGEWSLAAVVFENGAINIRNCTFENNLNAIGSASLQSDVLLYKCKFISINDSYPTPFGLTGFLGIGAASGSIPEENYLVTVANCFFTGNAVFATIGDYTDALFLFNLVHNFTNEREQEQDYRTESGSVCSYGNTSYNGSKGWGCSSATAIDTVFSRRNKLIKPLNTNPGNSPLMLGSHGFGTNFVSDNYLSGCVQVNTMLSNATTSYIYNNIIENNYSGSALNFENYNLTYQGGQVRFFNNLVRYTGDPYSQIVASHYTSPYIYNNDFLNFSTLHWSIGECDEIFTNNIIECTQWSSGGASQEHHPLLINNCLSMPLIDPWNLFDGGGNIVENPLFADTLNGDYSLLTNSPCIDAGAYRPDLPEFDIRYHKRIVPGLPNGPRSIDIGAFEFNSMYIGGITGYVYDSVSGLPVDCVKIDIQGKLPEFSDTLGCFQYPSGAGTYSVKASRWDYRDLIIPNVVVVQGEDTILNIPLVRTSVANDDNILSSEPINFGLTNYPNPFNPMTTISFITLLSGNVNLNVYNIKGQKVRTLYKGILSKGYHSFVWNGMDAKGAALSSGVYFVRVEMNDMHQSLKLIMIK
ncbi:MAG TPA: FlgD immunoglobulin-like domain containing protein [Candidatus Cloacimonadota bacterium]|nr:FlgD immunoglobulin-like domain containing protein [Candidatus Cloacimonadota bacterium]HOV16097.1 FlgD immunoglobulin-like domain containing protein [Candidatus Cloacimonadota bacterium]HQL14807.1 FlgD immunoglobulin-like domain containing protein [Candidatus Cloacimonadota bacterium]